MSEALLLSHRADNKGMYYRSKYSNTFGNSGISCGVNQDGTVIQESKSIKVGYPQDDFQHSGILISICIESTQGIYLNPFPEGSVGGYDSTHSYNNHVRFLIITPEVTTHTYYVEYYNEGDNVCKAGYTFRYVQEGSNKLLYVDSYAKEYEDGVYGLVTLYPSAIILQALISAN